MRTVAFFSQKGGSGKSTLAIHIAVAASFKHDVLLLDADPQGTSAIWSGERSKRSPTVMSADPSSIGRLLDQARERGHTLVVVDCPPHALPGTTLLLAAVDHIAIPVQPTMPDLAATRRALLLAQASKRPFSFVINRAPFRAPEITQAQEVLSAAGLLSPIAIGDRRAFSRALIESKAVTEFAREEDKAALEIVRYWRWLDNQISEATWPLQRAA